MELMPKEKQSSSKIRLQYSKLLCVTLRDLAWYEVAYKIAEESLCKDQHGCVIVKGGSVLALAANRDVESHPVSAQYLKRAIHAEQRAISKVYHKVLEGATLYSARAHYNYKSSPCEMCSNLINESGISKVVFHDGFSLVKVKI